MGSEQSNSRQSSRDEASQRAIEQVLEHHRLIHEATQRDVEKALAQQRIQQEAAKNANRVLQIERMKREAAEREAERVREIERIKREATQREMEQALEQQKIMYEQRCQELIRSQASAAEKSTSSRLSSPAQVLNDPLGAIQHPHAPAVGPLSALRTPSAPAVGPFGALRTSSVPAVGPHGALRQPHAPTVGPLGVSTPAYSSVRPLIHNERTIPAPNSSHSSLDNQRSFERNSTPYNYTREDLQIVMTTTNAPNTLYPNLNNNQASASTSRNNSTSSGVSSNSSVARNSVQDFVFVNNNGGAQSFKPSAPPRDRSTSSSRGRNNDASNLNCPTCKNKFGLNIYQCSNGHSSCKDCRMKLAACGICGMGITNMRNIMLEDYVSQQKVKCTNEADGCCLFVKLEELDAHLNECPFKETTCPVNTIPGNSCQWRGKISQMIAHFNTAHPAQRQADVDTEMYLPNICTDEHVMYFVVLGNFNFMFHLKVSEKDRMVYMAVQMFGTSFSAAKWSYEVHVYNKREPRRKFEYSDKCSSANIPVRDMFAESNCAALPLAYAMTFINEGLLTYKFYIKKENEPKREFVNKNYHGRGRGAIRKCQ